jgi:hypothetical protein
MKNTVLVLDAEIALMPAKPFSTTFTKAALEPGTSALIE